MAQRILSLALHMSANSGPSRAYRVTQSFHFDSLVSGSGWWLVISEFPETEMVS